MISREEENGVGGGRRVEVRNWVVFVEGRTKGKRNRLVDGSCLSRYVYHKMDFGSGLACEEGVFFLSDSVLIQAILFATGSAGGSFIPQQML